jgi:hypothetical protein
VASIALDGVATAAYYPQGHNVASILIRFAYRMFNWLRVSQGPGICRKPFWTRVRARIAWLKSVRFSGRDGEKPATARNSNEFESCSVRAICVAASEQRESRPRAQIDVACDLQLHFAGALPGMSVEGTALKSSSVVSAMHSTTGQLRRRAAVHCSQRIKYGSASLASRCRRLHIAA